MTLLAVPRPTAAADDLASSTRRVNQDSAAVRRNCSHARADVNARSADGSTALLWAAHWNDVATLDLLIARTPTRTSPTTSA
jgi:ankyrin repeat protein